MYKLRDFRARTKEAFDKAEKGEEVLIERAGAVFRLHLADMQVPLTVVNEPKKVAKSIKGMGMGWKPCRHGSDPQFCKFARPGKPCK